MIDIFGIRGDTDVGHLENGDPPISIQFVCMHDDMDHVARERRVNILAMHFNNVIETDYR